MTTVFKSDQKATSKVDNFVGYMGPADWQTYADFSSEVYKNGAGANLSMTDIITSPSQIEAAKIVDKLGNVAVSPAGIPRRSFIPAHGIFGVMAETANRGLYVNGSIVITTNTAAVYALYATKGSVLIDKSLVTVMSGTGTLYDPYLIKYKSQTTVPVDKDRADAVIVCVQCVGNRAPLNIITNQNNLSDSDLIVNIASINKSQFTIVIRTVSPKIGEGVLPAATGFVPIIKLYQDAANTLSYVKNRNTSLNIRAVINGINQDPEEAAPVTITVDTYAIAVDNGTITHYMNGAKINTHSVLRFNAFTLSEMRVLSVDSQWDVPKNSDALVNLIMYNRALSAAELASCVFK